MVGCKYVCVTIAFRSSGLWTFTMYVCMVKRERLHVKPKICFALEAKVWKIDIYQRWLFDLQMQAATQCRLSATVFTPLLVAFIYSLQSFSC